MSAWFRLWLVGTNHIGRIGWVSPFLRKVKTASGATAVQIVEKEHGQRRIVEHLGSAHSEAELVALVEIGIQKLRPGQDRLDLGTDDQGSPKAAGAVVRGSASRLLVEVVRGSWDRLGFGIVDDEAFFQLVLARLVEPTSKLDSLRVIGELGLPVPHRNTFNKALRRCVDKAYRDQLSAACFDHVWAGTGGDISLLLYDVTTLYFEAEKEDQLRRVGYSKERRVDPQILVGLLVDRSGFPLEIACFEGSKAETLTILPVVQAFQERHQIADMVVVADAGMLSAKNLQDIDEAQLRFIVGSRTTKAPHDLVKHCHWHGNAFTDGQIVDTITLKRWKSDPETLKSRSEPVWDREEYPNAWRAIWSYSAKRAARDVFTLNAQRSKAIGIVEDGKQARKTRFVKTSGTTLAFDEATWRRAETLVGLKGYVTNITAAVMPAAEVISSYHDLWHVEQSFRMSKHDLAARPIYHRKRDSIEAHLTIVFAALAIARDLQARTGWSIKKLIQTLRPLRHVTIGINGQTIEAAPATPPEVQEILRLAGH